jgi:predicted nucleotidyltransferase
MEISEQIAYWKNLADSDLEVARRFLQRGEDLHYCLFFCHMSLEKLIKGLVVAATKQAPPKIHDLMAQQSIPDSIFHDVRKLMAELEKENIRIERAILFGSQVLGTASEYSDIDVALVSPDFSGTRFLDNQRMTKAILRVNSGIETHPYTREDFLDSPFVRDEILRYGVEVR